jgi:hypothetical protein
VYFTGGAGIGERFRRFISFTVVSMLIIEALPANWRRNWREI